MDKTLNNLCIVIFGATGDLTKKKLIPALYEIFQGGNDFKIIGFARKEFSQEEFKQSYKNTTNPDQWNTFLQHIHYHKGDLLDIQKYKELRNENYTNNFLFYLAVDSEKFLPIIKNIHKSGLNFPESRIIIEKPFGNSKDSACKLYDNVKEVFNDRQIYIIDHYLGKETIQNILAFRFANSVFERIWNSKNIDSIQITSAESIGTEGRGGYYDKAGAIKDMLQSHIIQILAAVCMEPPLSFDPEELHKTRTKLIRSLKKYEDLSELVIGQYKGYTLEEKIEQNSKTETFIALKIFIENERWKNVPIYIRTGKKLQLRTTEVYIQFKKPEDDIFKSIDQKKYANILAFRIQPNEGISLKLVLKEPGENIQLKEVSMDFCYHDTFKISDNSYIRLLNDAINNNKSLFTSIDEIEASWEFIEPIVKLKSNNPDTLRIYEPLTWGPEGSENLIKSDNREWLSLYPYKCDVNIKV